MHLSRERTGPLSVQDTALWLATLALAALFFWTGVRKVLGAGGWVAGFTRWGYPSWFRVLIGVVEVSSAVLLLVPRLAVLGALGIAVIMVGAVGTLVTHGAARSIATPLACLCLALVIGWARRRDLMAMLRLTREEAPSAPSPRAPHSERG
jgi:putative oxidoreductase